MLKKKKRLGELLVEAKLIDELQLRSALSQQVKWGKPLGRTLVEMRLLTEEQLIPILSEQLNLPTVDLAAAELDVDALQFLDETYCREHECFPFAYRDSGKFLDVAMSDVQDQLLYDALRVRTRCNIRPFLAGSDAIRDAIERAFGQTLSDVELRVQLTESLFDFGDAAGTVNPRHVDPAVREQQPTEETRPVGRPPSRPTGPYKVGPEPVIPPPRDEAARSRVGGTASYAAPVFTPPTAAPATPAPARQRIEALEQRVTAVLARAERQETLVRELVVHLRDLFGQLADTNLIEVPTGHPLVRAAQPPAAPAGPKAKAAPVPDLESLAGLVPEAPRPAPPVVEKPRTPPSSPVERPRPAAPHAAGGKPRQGTALGMPIVEKRRTTTSRGARIVDERSEDGIASWAGGAEQPPILTPIEEEQPPILTPVPLYPPKAAPSRPEPAAPQAAPPEKPAPVEKPALVEAPAAGPGLATSPLVAAPRKPNPEVVRPAPPPATTADPTLPLIELPPDAPCVVAIDLGTTRSSVACVDHGRVVVLKLPGGGFDMPSVVGFQKDGKVTLGKNARQMLSTDPENAIASPKRLLGRRFDEPALGPYLSQLGMKASAGPNGDIVLRSRGRPVLISEACAHLLKLLQMVAERTLDRPVRDVILTVPVTSGERQLRALSAAAAQADLHVIEFLHEPVAAAMSCIFDSECQGLVAVYDFGGGTFDFSVVELAGDDMQVVASSGDSWLGGDDLDAALAAAAANAFWQQTKVELRNQVHLWQQLLVCAEQAKRELSENEETVLRLPKAIRTAQGQSDFEYPVSRKQFAKLIRGIIDRSLEACQDALSSKKLSPGDLNAIYLSGGTSYVPAVKQAVAEYFGREPRVVIPPERMVVVGAAVHGSLTAPGAQP